MFHYVHQLVANSVCLLFGAEQVVYGGFLRAVLLKTAACCSRNNTMRAVSVNQNREAAG